MSNTQLIAIYDIHVQQNETIFQPHLQFKRVNGLKLSRY